MRRAWKLYSSTWFAQLLFRLRSSVSRSLLRCLLTGLQIVPVLSRRCVQLGQGTRYRQLACSARMWLVACPAAVVGASACCWGAACVAAASVHLTHQLMAA